MRHTQYLPMKCRYFYPAPASIIRWLDTYSALGSISFWFFWFSIHQLEVTICFLTRYCAALFSDNDLFNFQMNIGSEDSAKETNYIRGFRFLVNTLHVCPMSSARDTTTSNTFHKYFMHCLHYSVFVIRPSTGHKTQTNNKPKAAATQHFRRIFLLYVSYSISRIDKYIFGSTRVGNHMCMRASLRIYILRGSSS